MAMSDTQAIVEAERRTCISCGSEFSISPGERTFYLSRYDRNGRQLALPKRCASCRAKRRLASASPRSPRWPFDEQRGA